MDSSITSGDGPELLYLVHRFPYPPDKGDRIRAFQLLRYLCRRARVHLACLADEPVDPEARATLERFCVRLAVQPTGGVLRWANSLHSLATGRTATEGAFRSRGLEATLLDWARQTRFHTVLTSASSMVPYLRLPGLRDVPAVVDLVDVDSQKWLDYAAADRPPRSWLYRLEGQRLRHLEQDLPAQVRAVALVTQAEAALYEQFCAPGRVQVVGNGVDLDYFQPQDVAEERRCVFVGAMDYRPNVEGACWFAHEVWPALHHRHPDARFALVGRSPTPAVRRLAELPGVEVVGPVPDVRPHLARAAVAVVPLHIARGLQNKVLEALSMGKAVVVSPQAIQGLQTQPGRHLLTAASPQEWQTTVADLFDQPERRRQLGDAGRRFVLNHHHWDRCLEPMAALLGLPTTAAAAV